MRPRSWFGHRGGKHRSGGWAIAIAGSIALAVAMGIGRFAFTPLLPLMLHERQINLVEGGWLATANYAGYFCGAALCMGWPRLRQCLKRPPTSGTILRACLIATAVLTAAMVPELSSLWLPLRFTSGVISAGVFVFTSSWCLGRLAEVGAPELGALIFTGPGIGIALSGLLVIALTAGDQTAAAGWLGFSLLALVLTAVIWSTLRGPDPAWQTRPAPGAAVRPEASRVEKAVFLTAYCLAGFGYIITATYLPVMARTLDPHALLSALFWPVFGGAIVVGAILARYVSLRLDSRVLLAGCFSVQATGVLIAANCGSLAGLGIGSLLIGLPFTVISLFAMREARRLAPFHETHFIGLATAFYGMGQIAGPLLATALLAGSTNSTTALASALYCAAAGLAIGAGQFIWLSSAYPSRMRSAGVVGQAQ